MTPTKWLNLFKGINRKRKNQPKTVYFPYI